MASSEAVRERLEARAAEHGDRLAAGTIACLDALAGLAGADEAVGELLVAARLLCFERGVDTGDVTPPVVSFRGTPVDHPSPLTAEVEGLEPGPVREALEGLAVLHAAVLTLRSTTATTTACSARARRWRRRRGQTKPSVRQLRRVLASRCASSWRCPRTRAAFWCFCPRVASTPSSCAC